MPNKNRDDQTCCPKFDPKIWDEKSFTWNNKLFIKGSMWTFFHIPLPPSVGKLITKLWKQSEDAKASPELNDWLLLANDPTLFKCDYYMAVTKEVPGADNVKLSGNFTAKVFEGPYSDVPKWIKQMEEFLKSRNKVANKYYFYYTTCPKCAKIYGHNYVVAVVETK